MLALAPFASAQTKEEPILVPIYTEADKELAAQITSFDKTGAIYSKTSEYVNSKETKAVSIDQLRQATRYTINQTGAKVGLVPWVGCKCDSPVVLAAYDFENLAAGSTFTSVPASSTASNISATNIAGPGGGVITNSNSAGSNFGCFGGFGSTTAGAGTGSIGFSISNDSTASFCISDMSFDFFQESRGETLFGPTEFYVEVLDGSGALLFLSDFVSTAGTSSTNIGSFAMSGQMGDLVDTSLDWVDFNPGDSLTFNIVGSGAEQLGLDIDNVMVTACPVPEPSSSLLILLGSSVMILRRKR